MKLVCVSTSQQERMPSSNQAMPYVSARTTTTDNTCTTNSTRCTHNMYACGHGRGSGSMAYSRATRGCHCASSNRPGAKENQPRTFATGLARACAPLSPSARRGSTATAAQSVPEATPPWALLPLEPLSLPQGRHCARHLLDRTTAATGTAAPCYSWLAISPVQSHRPGLDPTSHKGSQCLQPNKNRNPRAPAPYMTRSSLFCASRRISPLWDPTKMRAIWCGCMPSVHPTCTEPTESPEKHPHRI